MLSRNNWYRSLFLRQVLPSTLIRHENGACWKLSSNRGEFENDGFAFQCGRKTVSIRNFQKTIASRSTGDCFIFKLSGVVWTENISVDTFLKRKLRFKICLTKFGRRPTVCWFIEKCCSKEINLANEHLLPPITLHRVNNTFISYLI